MTMKFNWFYALIAVLFVSMLYINSKYFRGSSNVVVGITQAKDYKINAEKSSLVKAVHVVPGKQVKAGDLLIELTSEELAIDIAKLANRIELLTSEEKDKKKLVDSEIAYIRAENAIDIEEIDADINEIKTQQKLNQRLSEELNTSHKSSSEISENPALQKIASLEQQKVRRRDAVNIKIQDIMQESNTDQNQLHNQIALLVQELELLKGEQKKLSKFASGDGVVENVYVKDGEQIEAYTSLLSIGPLRPTTVVGYIYGRRMPIDIGDKVTVTSYEKKSFEVEGSVIGFGTVSALPEILQKSTAVTAFGQEVFIAIKPENSFAIGEKVLIK